jgi:hypothetical protein
VELMLLLPVVSYAAQTAETAAAAGTLAAGLAPMIGAAMTLFQKKRLSARAAMLLEALEGLASTSASACQPKQQQQQQQQQQQPQRPDL